MSSCQLGLAFWFLEEDGAWVIAHLHVLHPFLVLFFDGGVPECGLEFLDECVPMWVSESRASGIAIVVDPKILSSVGPPVSSTDEPLGSVRSEFADFA